MDWITDTIAIGNYLDAEDRELRHAAGIRSMICLNGKLKGISPEDMGLDGLENYDLKDGPGNDPAIFQRVVESVGRFAAIHPKLLVQCHAGRSRSVVVVAAHLMRKYGWDSSEAFSFVAALREIALTAGIEKLLFGPPVLSIPFLFLNVKAGVASSGAAEFFFEHGFIMSYAVLSVFVLYRVTTNFISKRKGQEAGDVLQVEDRKGG